MPVPKRRRSQARRDKQKAGRPKLGGFGISPSCQTCGIVVVQHSVCRNCGHYKGRKIMSTKTDRAALRKTTRDVRSKAKNKNLAAQRATSQE